MTKTRLKVSKLQLLLDCKCSLIVLKLLYLLEFKILRLIKLNENRGMNVSLRTLTRPNITVSIIVLTGMARHTAEVQCSISTSHQYEFPST